MTDSASSTMSRQNKKTGMGRSMLVNFAGIFCSRIFGLLRDVAMTWYWGGSGAAQGAFHLAFSIPNMFRMLFGEGAFTAAFVPAVADKLEKGDKEGAWRLAERTISLQILALFLMVSIVSAISGIALVFVPPDAREHIPLTLKILPVLMPYALLICLAGSFASILNALRKFALPAANPVIFNIVQIAAVLLLSRTCSNNEPKSLYLFCLSVLLAGVLQVVSLLIACRRSGFVFHFRPIWKDDDVKAVCRRFLPGTIGAGANQINQLLDKVMVAWLGPLAISSIAYSNHLIYLPVGLFGVAMGVVCLTDMSRAASRQDSEALAQSLDYALRVVLFLSLPCAIFFCAMAQPLVHLFYCRGAFDADAARECVWALLFYLPGIPAFCCAKIATTPHHANKDTSTPVKISMACIVINFILNISLIWSLKQGGLALATSICSWINVIVLLIMARKYVPTWKPMETFIAGMKLLVAASLGGVAARYTIIALPQLPQMHHTIYALVQVVTGGVAGTIVYIVFCLLLLRNIPLIKKNKSI